MSWRRLRVLTLILLVLLILAPLSSGDKGLWLSLASTPVQHLDVATDRLPAEHSILLPERAARTGRVAAISRTDRADAANGDDPSGPIWSLGADRRWTVAVNAPRYPHGEPFAARPAPRAPPA
jgi:hypothetical protein